MTDAIYLAYRNILFVFSYVLEPNSKCALLVILLI